MPVKKNGFRGISLKTEIINDIEKFIKEHPERGYKSKADFITDAVRCRIDELRRHYKLIEE